MRRYNSCVAIGTYPKWFGLLLAWFLRKRLPEEVKIKLYGRGKGAFHKKINFGAWPIRFCPRVALYVYFIDGLKEKQQKSGEWISGYRKYFMLNGLVVPKKLFEAKPEDLDPNTVLRQPNAQVRAMLLKKIGIARVVKECKGTLVDKDPVTGNELYDFKTGTPKTAEDIERFERILKVVCPSTRNEYFLRIPYDEHFNTTEKARQGTFNGFDPDAKPIAFAIET